MTLPAHLDHLAEPVRRAFERRFGGRPDFWVRSPGRVNLIGEHTDYNDGFVLPIAIERQVLFGARRADPSPSPSPAKGGGADSPFPAREGARRVDPSPSPSPAKGGGADSPFPAREGGRGVRSDRGPLLRLYSATLKSGDQFNPAYLRHAKGWRDYARGVVWALREAKYPIKTGDIALAGDVPLAAGLSSSAAFEVGLGWTLAHLGGFTVDRAQLALLMQRTENRWVGVQSGIMDQFIVALGQADHALLVDTRDLSYQAVPMPKGTSVVIADTNVKRGLVTSEYNARREETAEAAKRLGASSLRDVAWEGFEARAADLPDLLRRRARHVVSENDRVMQAVQALRAGDVALFGHLMNESHRSLADDYAVSHPNLDLLVDLARRQPGVYGARMTGAGFGGATVSLVADGAVPDFVREVGRAYAEATGTPPPIYVTRATNGVEVLA